MTDASEQGKPVPPFAEECARLRTILLSSDSHVGEAADLFDRAKTIKELNALEKEFDTMQTEKPPAWVEKPDRLNCVHCLDLAIDLNRSRLKTERREAKYADEHDEIMEALPFVASYACELVYYKASYFAKEPPREDGSFDRRVFKFHFGELIEITLGFYEKPVHVRYPRYGHRHSTLLGAQYASGVASIHFVPGSCFFDLFQRNVVDIVSFCYAKVRGIDELFKVRVAYQLICRVAEEWSRRKYVRSHRLLQQALDARCGIALKPGSKTKPAKRERDEIKCDGDDGAPSKKRAKLNDTNSQGVDKQ